MYGAGQTQIDIVPKAPDTQATVTEDNELHGLQRPKPDSHRFAGHDASNKERVFPFDRHVRWPVTKSAQISDLAAH